MVKRTPISVFSPRADRGVMLLELMMALAVTAILGVGITGILIAAIQGTATRSDMQGSLVSLGLLTGRINASIRESGMVLAAENDYLLLWTADLRSNGVPNLSELRLIQRDTDTGEIGQSEFGFAAGLTELELAALDTGYPLSTDFVALLNSLAAGGQLLYTPWCEGLSEWTITTNNASDPLANVVSYRLTLAVGQVVETAVSSAKLRNR